MGKWLLFFALGLLLPGRVFALYEVGDVVGDHCATNELGDEVCLDDFRDTVRVLIYSAGWCLPCNREIRELSGRVVELKDEPVVFLNILAEGAGHGDQPDRKFLARWREIHQIPQEIVTLGNYRDFAHNFSSNAGIPYVVVIDQESKLRHKRAGESVDAVFKMVRKLLSGN